MFNWINKKIEENQFKKYCKIHDRRKYEAGIPYILEYGKPDDSTSIGGSDGLFQTVEKKYLSLKQNQEYEKKLFADFKKSKQ
jgi:hypothetical protein